jgi:hypothetical protein
VSILIIFRSYTASALSGASKNVRCGWQRRGQTDQIITCRDIAGPDKRGQTRWIWTVQVIFDRIKARTGFKRTGLNKFYCTARYNSSTLEYCFLVPTKYSFVTGTHSGACRFIIANLKCIEPALHKKTHHYACTSILCTDGFFRGLCSPESDSRRAWSRASVISGVWDPKKIAGVISPILRVSGHVHH